MKPYKTIFTLLFLLLIGILPLLLPRAVYGDRTFSLTSTNTSWVKDFLAKNPQYTEKDIVKRDAYSVHFKQPDGSIVAEIAQTPINYQDNQGSWKTLDTAITKADNSSYDYQNTTNSFQTLFSSDAYQDAGNIQLVKGDASLTIKTIDKLTFADRNETLTMSDLAPKTAEEKLAKKGVVDPVDQNKICYPQLYKKEGKTIDVCYIVHEGRIQEQLILNAYQGYPELTQTITLHNAFAKKEGKQIAFYNAKTNELLWYILDPVIYEQYRKSENHDLHYDLSCTTSGIPLDRCTDFTITKILEPNAKAYLADPKRQYPITIDPDYACTTADADIYSNTTPYATAHTTPDGIDDVTENWVGQLIYSGNYNINRTYLEFDTSAIPDTSTVTQVNLKLVVTEDDSSTDFDVDIVKQNWSAQDPLSSGNQSTAYNNTLSAALDSSIWRNTSGMSTNTQYTSGNLATDWVNLTGSTYYSLISSRDKTSTTPTGDEYIKLASQSNATTGYRPILTVTYSTGKANGQSCSLGSECTSTYCVDSTCCNVSSCSGTCKTCDADSHSGAGTCDYIGTATDPDSECGALDCHTGGTKYYNGWDSSTYGTCYYKADISAGSAICTGTSAACKTAATMCAASSQGVSTGVSANGCQTVSGCSGTTAGSMTGNVAANTDPNNACASLNCPSKVWGWNGNFCQSAMANTTDGMCNGGGACNNAFEVNCMSSEATVASCGSSACKNISTCVNGSDSTTSDTPAKICYTSGQHGCSNGLYCDATGTCSPPSSCASVPVSGDFTLTNTCAFPNTVDGVDAGSGSTNTAKINVGSGGTPGYLTVLAGQTIAVGSISMANGAINIIKGSPGGIIKLKTPLYMPDADGDGYPVSSTATQYLTAGANRARRSAGLDYNDNSSAVKPGATCNGVCSINNADGTCTAVAAGENALAACTRCNGVSLSAVNITNDTQDSEGSNSCIGTCKKCSSGSCANQTNAQDLFSQCPGFDCDGGGTKYYNGWASNVCYYEADVSAANALCDGSGACTAIAVACPASSQGASAGVTRTTCKSQVGCTGTTIGSLGNVSAGADDFNECASYGCTSKVNGWSGNACIAAVAGTNDGDCNGSGACNTTFASQCAGGGTTLATCGSAGCVNASACVQDTATTTSDTIAKVCYTSAQHGCSAGQVCLASTATCTTAATNSGAKVSGTVVSSTNWSNYTTARIGTSDNSYATTAQTTAAPAVTRNYDFSAIPAGSTINGVTVTVEMSSSNASGTAYEKVRITKDGGTNWSAYTAEQSVASTTDSTKTFGTSSTIFGLASLSLAEVQNTTNFRVDTAGRESSASYTSRIDYVAVTVYYTLP